MLLTRSPLYFRPEGRFRARLACVKHAASVHSEPGSNSPVESCMAEPKPSHFFRNCCAPGQEPGGTSDGWVLIRRDHPARQTIDVDRILYSVFKEPTPPREGEPRAYDNTSASSRPAASDLGADRRPDSQNPLASDRTTGVGFWSFSGLEQPFTGAHLGASEAV